MSYNYNWELLIIIQFCISSFILITYYENTQCWLNICVVTICGLWVHLKYINIKYSVGYIRLLKCIYAFICETFIMIILFIIPCSSHIQTKNDIIFYYFHRILLTIEFVYTIIFLLLTITYSGYGLTRDNRIIPI